MMKKQTNRELIDEMSLMLEDNSKLTLESFVMPHIEDKNEKKFDKNNENFIDNLNQEQNVGHIDSQVKPLIDKIRVIALEGIMKLASKPESPSYDILKKIWVLTDKSIESE